MRRMSFDYLVSKIPDQVRKRAPASNKRMHEEEIRYRAALYRRLGRDKDTAVQRCLAHLAWTYEIAGKSPVSDREVKALVEAVYK